MRSNRGSTVTAIFISHSTRDKTVALRVLERLRERGYRSLFLDSDPEAGIKAGVDWERDLYRNLRLAGAVVVLCSPDSMASRWCFAEITQAKALGKPIFPVVIRPCELVGSLSDRQAIDLAGRGEEEGFCRLFDGLRVAGLDPADSFGWDPRRPPYPGLLYFDREDAGIYFGRDPEVRWVIELLTRLRLPGEPRLAVVIGSSGSGKSSLVRAGVLPRLAKDPDRWAVVPPFRPGADPVGELARAVASAFPERPSRPDWKALRDRLKAEHRAAPDVTPSLVDAADDLAMSLGRREASVLVVVDQAEELLQVAAAGDAEDFFAVLLRALGWPGRRVFALLTLRSDFLGSFQNHPAMRGVPFADMPLGLMPVESFPQVIEGPAARAEITLDPGLVTRMIYEAETDDALPLLAFTLREMYERCRDDARFTLKVYRDDLGGIQGSVLRVVERIKAESGWTPEVEHALRRAFLKLVQVNDEGRFTRRRARWADLPDQAAPVLEKFVRARLLASDGDMVEVAHESLFRSWPDLEGWLAAGRELMLWKRGIADEMAAWERNGHSGRFLAPGRVAEARRWLAESPDEFDAESPFLTAQIAEEDRVVAEEDARRRRELEVQRQLAAEAEARKREAEAAAAHQKKLSQRLLIAAAVSLLLALAAGLQTWRANRASEQALAARDRIARDLTRRLCDGALREFNQGHLADGVSLMRQALDHARAKEPDVSRSLARHLDAWRSDLGVRIATGAPLEFVGFDGRGDSVLLASGGRLNIHKRATGGYESSRDPAKAVASLDEKWLVTADGSGARALWSVPPGDRARWSIYTPRPASRVMASCPRLLLDVTPDRDAALALTPDKRSFEVWDLRSGEVRSSGVRHQAGIASGGFSNGARLVYTTSTSPGGTDINFYRISDFQPVGPPVTLTGSLIAAGFLPDPASGVAGYERGQDAFFTVTSDGGVRHWAVGPPPAGTKWSLDSYDEIKLVSPKGRLLVTEYSDQPRAQLTVRSVFTGLGKNASSRLTPVASLEADPESSLLLFGFTDQTALLFRYQEARDRVELTPLTSLSHDSEVQFVAFGRDYHDGYRGQLFLTATGHEVDVWATATGARVGRPIRTEAQIRAAGFTPDRKSLFVATDAALRIRPADMTDVDLVRLRSPKSNWYRLCPDGGKLLESDVYGREATFFDVIRGSRLGKPFSISEVRNRPSSDRPGEFFQDQADISVSAFDVNGRYFVARSNFVVRSNHDNVRITLWSVDGVRLGSSAECRITDGSYDGVVAISPDAGTVLLADRSGTRRWDVSARTISGYRQSHPSPVSAMAYSRDGTALATGFEDGVLTVQRPGSPGSGGAMARHGERVVCVGFSPDNGLVMTAGPATLRLWDARTLTPTGFDVRHRVDDISVGRFSPDGEMIAVAGGPTAMLWDVATGQPLGPPMRHLRHRFPESIEEVEFSGDGTLLHCQANSLYSWRVPSAKSDPGVGW
jgi:WD40 repeat protein